MESLKTELPTFSVIIPVYNKGPHIERCIQSVLNQKYKDYEIIVVHDPSTDNSLKEIKKFDKYIRLYERSKPGPGGYAARNFGIKNALGEWIAFLDADDEWNKNHLSIRASLLDKYPDAEILSSGWKITYGEKDHDLDPYYKMNSSKGDHLISLSNYISRYRPIWTSVATIRKDLFKKYGDFDECWKHGADKEMWIRLFLEGAEGAWAADITACYHRDSVNMVTSGFSQSYSPTSFRIREFLNGVKNHPMEKKLKKTSNIEEIKALLRGSIKKQTSIQKIKGKIYLDLFVLFDVKQITSVTLLMLTCVLPVQINRKLVDILNNWYNI